jgi:hypothetical protein
MDRILSESASGMLVVSLAAATMQMQRTKIIKTKEYRLVRALGLTPPPAKQPLPSPQELYALHYGLVALDEGCQLIVRCVMLGCRVCRRPASLSFVFSVDVALLWCGQDRSGHDHAQCHTICDH